MKTQLKIGDYTILTCPDGWYFLKDGDTINIDDELGFAEIITESLKNKNVLLSLDTGTKVVRKFCYCPIVNIIDGVMYANITVKQGSTEETYLIKVDDICICS